MLFHAALLAAAALGGALAGVAGFGIGSVLTPLLAVALGTKTAVAAVSVPHAIGTAARFLSLRRAVDRRVLVAFGILSAAGGLAGALLHERAKSPALGIAFGLLLVFAGVSTFFGLMSRLRLGKKTAAAAGLTSGLFGGLVGNQGGIRAAALTGFGLGKESFVATATAIALVVDAARMPVYVAGEWSAMRQAWSLIALATAGVLLGTFAGVKILRRIPEALFRKSVAVLLFLLGAFMLARAFPRSAEAAPLRYDRPMGLFGTSTPMPKEGEKAPDFTLKDQHGKDVALSSLKGKRVVLYFYPKADTPGCTKESCAFRDESPKLPEGVVVIGVSKDSVASQKGFANKYGLTFPLLADAKGEVIERYGVSGLFGFARRVTFLIDADGNVAKVWPIVNPEKHAAQVAEALRA